MGFRQQMLNMFLSGKSPEEISSIMSEMMPLMMEKMGPEDMAQVMLNVMPGMMDSCFSGMDREQRRLVLTRFRSILDSMDEKYRA